MPDKVLTPEEQVEMVKQRMADVIIDNLFGHRGVALDVVRQILALKDSSGNPLLAVIHPDQTTPKNIYIGASSRLGFNLAQDEMLKDGFKRVI